MITFIYITDNISSVISPTCHVQGMPIYGPCPPMTTPYGQKMAFKNKSGGAAAAPSRCREDAPPRGTQTLPAAECRTLSGGRHAHHHSSQVSRTHGTAVGVGARSSGTHRRRRAVDELAEPLVDVVDGVSRRELLGAA